MFRKEIQLTGVSSYVALAICILIAIPLVIWTVPFLLVSLVWLLAFVILFVLAAGIIVVFTLAYDYIRSIFKKKE